MASQQHWRTDPVCDCPKVFLGGLPFELSEGEIREVFAKYGAIVHCDVLRGPNGASKGAAMVLYSRWAEAEAAVEAENGGVGLTKGGKPLVAKIADPPKNSPGIAPKKLFVGRLPDGTSEEHIRALFSAYGVVTDVHVLHKDATSDCAFVTMERWSQAEAAIEALNGQNPLPGAKAPLSVKFATPKPSGGAAGGDSPYGHHLPGDKRSGMEGGGPMPAKRGMQYMGGWSPGPMLPGPYGAMGFAPPPQMAAAAAVPPNGGGRFHGPPASSSGNGVAGGYYAPMPMGPGVWQPGGMNGMGPYGGGPMAVMPMHMAAPPHLGGGGGRGGGAWNGGGHHGGGGHGRDESAKPWKLFVGQVPFEAGEADLWGAFASLGPILDLVILRLHDGRSKGCGFVTYATAEAAEAAIRQFDRQLVLPGDPKGRTLVVKYAAQPQQHGGGGGQQQAQQQQGGGGGGDGGAMVQ